MRIRSLIAPNPGPYTLDGTHTYLLGESAVIDPGPVIESHIEAILAAVPKLTTIFITHRHDDHAPAAIPLREKTGARIVAPQGVLYDADVAIRIRGGEFLEVDDERLEVIATPGHTSEHVCFLTAARELFSGDTILGSGTTTIFPPDGSMSDYLRSLQLLRERKPVRIYPAHGPEHEDADGLIAHYIAHRLEREQQVLNALAAGDQSSATIRLRIYPDLAEALHYAAEVQIDAHLRKLREEGRA